MGKEYTPFLPSLYLSPGVSYYIKKRLEINVDLFLYKELYNLNDYSRNYSVFFGIEVAYYF